ncbi:hypothetical protein AGMMS49991_05190 [Spirochaetia bacterium]|nr:hypothetical protein AGMMS49991_05190 [Spirochaetia bacterium]
MSKLRSIGNRKQFRSSFLHPAPVAAGTVVGALILVLALGLNCALVFGQGGRDTARPGAAADQSVDTASAAPLRIVTQPRAAVIPDSLRSGEPLAVGLVLPAEAGGTVSGTSGEGRLYAILLNAQGKRLGRAAFFTIEEDSTITGGGAVLKAAILAAPSTMVPQTGYIRIEGIEGFDVEDIPIIITERDFAAEVIDLDQGNTNIRTVPDPQKTLESEQLWAILNRTGGDMYAVGAFTPPVSATRRTSFFGDRRVYRYVNGSTDTSVHAGIDYGVPKGTPVSACAPGKVLLARFRISTGNSVIIEHLPGVYSLYYHLDSIAVAEGALVGAGELLGESGSTGLATGPHLHWEIRAAGENADPDAFVAHPVLDTSEIFSKLDW